MMSLLPDKTYGMACSPNENPYRLRHQPDLIHVSQFGAQWIALAFLVRTAMSNQTGWIPGSIFVIALHTGYADGSVMQGLN